MSLSGSALGRRRYRKSLTRTDNEFRQRNWDYSANPAQEILFQVAHYNRYYGTASNADVETELGSTTSTDKAIVTAKERGEQYSVEQILEQARDRGLVEGNEKDGWKITEKGRGVLPNFYETSTEKYEREYQEHPAHEH